MNINKKIIKNNNSFYKDIYGEEKGIIELKLEDFNYKDKKLHIKNSYFNDKKGFIIFYAPWCKHCNKISNLLIDLALLNINIFNFGSINAENIKDGNDKVCIYENITKFPTIKYINTDGTLLDYQYEYTLDNLLYFINTNL
jgi:thiol-disulfide isomerase/thioredoxin